MSTLREHLQKIHTRSAEHHLTKAKGYLGLAKCLKMQKADMGDDDADPEDISSTLADLAEEENDMAQFHLECCAGLDKVQGGDLIKSDMDGDRIVPDGISVIVGDVPQHVRAIPRNGQREIETAQVAPGLEKIVGFDD